MSDLDVQSNPAELRPDSDFQRICPYCGKDTIKVKYRIENHRIMRCTACTLMWLFPRPKLDELHEVYDESYFQNTDFFEGTSSLYGYYDYLEERFMKQSAYQGMVRHIKQYVPGFKAGKSRFLDIGCGMGYLLDVAQDEGFWIKGVEFNRVAAARLRLKYVFPVFSGDVLEFKDDPYEVITLMDVIEHLLDPLEYLAHVKTLLKPGGILVMSTMDCDGIVSKVLGTRIEDFRRVREHMFFFTRKSLTDILEKQGFEVIKIKSHGHYFRLGFLANRIKLMSPMAGRILGSIVKLLHIDQMTMYVNPFTKMIIYARRKS